MEFTILREDPLFVLSSTKPIVENLTYIVINEKNLEAIVRIVDQKLEKGLDIVDTHFGKAGNLVDDVQLIFIEDVVNFCFWAEKGKPKWQIEWPKGTVSSGGWYTLTKCFQRAFVNKVPILEADYLENFTLEQSEALFSGIAGTEIPLLTQRVKNLQEAGRVLKEKYNGKFINAIEQADFNAVEIAKLLYKDFPSFRDNIVWQGETIYFLKRAQICGQDFSYLSQIYKDFKINGVDLLTAFADYKVPQMLRKYGVIEYTKELSNTIDNYVLIPYGSLEEIEIRTATIWCIELIRQKLKKYTASDIDNALWLISQDQTNVKPYHRTYTIYY